MRSNAVLARMAYADLNPTGNGMADRPDASDYISLQDRLSIAPKDCLDFLTLKFYIGSAQTPEAEDTAS